MITLIVMAVILLMVIVMIVIFMIVYIIIVMIMVIPNIFYSRNYDSNIVDDNNDYNYIFLFFFFFLSLFPLCFFFPFTFLIFFPFFLSFFHPSLFLSSFFLQFDSYKYTVEHQDTDAQLFSYLNLNNEKNDLIFTYSDDNKRKINENNYNKNIYENNYDNNNNNNNNNSNNNINNNNGDIELKKNEILKYESFPNLSKNNNSNNDGFSSTNLDQINEQNNDNFHVSSIMEKISTTFSYIGTKGLNQYFKKLNNGENINYDGNTGVNGRNGIIDSNEESPNLIQIRKSNEIDNNNDNKNDNENNIINKNEKKGYKNTNKKNGNINSENKIMTENDRILHNIKILNLSERQLDAISRFSSHCRIQEPYNDNVISCLPKSLEKFKKYIVMFMLSVFTLIILLTIIMTVLDAIMPESDDIPDNWNKVIISPEYDFSH